LVIDALLLVAGSPLLRRWVSGLLEDHREEVSLAQRIVESVCERFGAIT
jgi:hypothetical protein